MNRIRLYVIVMAFIVIAVLPAHAYLANLDPVVRVEQMKKAVALYEAGDAAGLREMLKDSHMFIQQDVALRLGRLGDEQSLEMLKNLDAQYKNFACAPSGQFGVAVMLIENKTADARKKALLKAATATDYKQYASSVVDCAGRELVFYADEEVAAALKDVRTYGAQYTVLRWECYRTSDNHAIEKSIGVLEQHETPQKAEAAEDILKEYGAASIEAVMALKERVAKKVDPEITGHTIEKTIVSRCEEILRSAKKQAPDIPTFYQEKGMCLAWQDIREGNMKIIYYGRPLGPDAAVDKESGLPLDQRGCMVWSKNLLAEAEAYNKIMRREAKRRAEETGE